MKRILSLLWLMLPATSRAVPTTQYRGTEELHRIDRPSSIASEPRKAAESLVRSPGSLVGVRDQGPGTRGQGLRLETLGTQFPCCATQEEKPAAPSDGSELPSKAVAAIEKGLAWLAKNQSKSGMWGSGGAPVATTAIAGLAFLAGGHVPKRSKYGENVLQAVKFLLKCTSKKGYINEGSARFSGGSGMHGHGYAALFLAEVYGMCTGIEGFGSSDLETELKEKLTAAIRIIESSQAPNGGWTYDPSPSGDEGSVTITQVQALRAARNAGIKVNLKTIDKALDYINKSTDANGQTRYSLNGDGRTSLTLTAAGMSCLNFLGQYDNEKLKKGLDSLLQALPGKGNLDGWEGYYFYTGYYASIAMYQAKDSKYWTTWWPAIREDLIRTQSGDGSWQGGESGSYGAAFGTGFALQILQIPCRYLPIFQAGKD